MLTGTILAIGLFLCFYLAYKEGLRLGMNTARGIIPEPIKTPIKAYEEYKVNKEEVKRKAKEEEEIINMLNYNGEPVKKVGE